jgi:hypothetical protein
MQLRCGKGIFGNEKADFLAKEALNLPNITPAYIPYTDIKQNINSFVQNIWQEEWDFCTDNKLHEIQTSVNKVFIYKNLTRREERTLCRLRTGHSYLTHSYLLKGENFPVCTQCGSRLTIKHILFDCLDFSLRRENYFKAEQYKDIFEKISIFEVFDFLKDINIFYQI